MYEYLDRELWGSRGWDGDSREPVLRGRGMLVVSWHAFTLGAVGKGRSGLNKCGNIGCKHRFTPTGYATDQEPGGGCVASCFVAHVPPRAMPFRP
jgi:hypothetical protein